MEICKACVMLEGLNKGKPKLGIGKSSKVVQHFESESPSNEVSRNRSLDF